MNYLPAVSWGIYGAQTRNQRASYFVSWGLIADAYVTWTSTLWVHVVNGTVYLAKLGIAVLNHKIIVKEDGKLLFNLKPKIYLEL